MPINTSGLVNRVALGMIANNQRKAAAQEDATQKEIAAKQDLTNRQNAAMAYKDDAYRKADEAVNRAFYDRRRYQINMQYTKEKSNIYKHFKAGTPERQKALEDLQARDLTRKQRLEYDREYGMASWTEAYLAGRSLSDAVYSANYTSNNYTDDQLLGEYSNEISKLQASNKAAINAKFGLDEKGGRK